MARPRKFTDEEVKYVKKYYPKYKTALIAEQLGKTMGDVYRLAWRNNYKKADKLSKKPLPEFNLSPLIITDRKSYGIVMDEQVAKRLDEHFLNPGTYPSYDPKCLQPKPQKNWLRRLVSWLLTGEV